MTNTAPSRRTIAKGVAWTAPAIMVGAAAPASAASPACATYQGRYSFGGGFQYTGLTFFTRKWQTGSTATVTFGLPRQDIPAFADTASIPAVTNTVTRLDAEVGPWPFKVTWGTFAGWTVSLSRAPGSGTGQQWYYNFAPVLPLTVSVSTPVNNFPTPPGTAANSIPQPSFSGTGVNGTGILVNGTTIPSSYDFVSTLTLRSTRTSVACGTSAFDADNFTLTTTFS